MADREEMIAWLRQFWGIGPKYARNLMMDMYHRRFRNSIAVDVRIQNVLRRVGRPFTGPNDYGDVEEFLITVAEAAGIDGWTLDRMLFRYQDEILSALPVKSESDAAEDILVPLHLEPDDEATITRAAAIARSDMADFIVRAAVNAAVSLIAKGTDPIR